MSETTREQRLAWMESDGSHLNARCVKMLLRDYAVLEAQLAACEWKPITETDLPKDGDEVIKAIPGDGWAIEIEAVNLSRTRINPTSKFYLRYGKTHFRPINPPQQGNP